MKMFDDGLCDDLWRDSNDAFGNGQKSKPHWFFRSRGPTSGSEGDPESARSVLRDLIIDLLKRSDRLEKKARRSASLFKTLLEIEDIAIEGGPDAMEKILQKVPNRTDRNRHDSKN
ncbi:MAG: hypothetical protein IPK83_19080 [Planctomycetes bacterium]|nr:hypothetical protein [Planctomycetota bacterium]